MKHIPNLLNFALVLAGLGIVLSILSEVQMPERPPTFAAAAPIATPTVVVILSANGPTPQAPNNSPARPTPAMSTPMLSNNRASAGVADRPSDPATARPSDQLPNTLNLILLGSDRLPGHVDFRTDTMIVLMIDPQNKQTGVINIPRDLWVDIPGKGMNKINTVDEFRGKAVVKQVVGDLLGIPIDYYASIDFNGFKQAIDALGGVTVEVDCPLEDFFQDGTPGGRRLKWTPGKTQMNGQMALDYSRTRITTTIFDRMRRQSRVLLGVREKLLSPAVFPHIPELWEIAGKWVQTDLPARNVIPLAKLASEMKLSDVHGLTIDERLAKVSTSPQGSWIMRPDVARIRAAVRSLFVAQPLTELVVKSKPCR